STASSMRRRFTTLAAARAAQPLKNTSRKMPFRSSKPIGLVLKRFEVAGCGHQVVAAERMQRLVNLLNTPAKPAEFLHERLNGKIIKGRIIDQVLVVVQGLRQAEWIGEQIGFGRQVHAVLAQQAP